jgi:hypothetical protein
MSLDPRRIKRPPIIEGQRYTFGRSEAKAPHAADAP